MLFICPSLSISLITVTYISLGIISSIHTKGKKIEKKSRHKSCTSPSLSKRTTGKQVIGISFSAPDALVGASPKPQAARSAFGRTCLTARLCRSRWSLIPAHPRGKMRGAVSAPAAPITARFFILASPSASRGRSRSAPVPASARSVPLPPCRRVVRHCRPPARPRRN